jgi:arylsulfatase A-like enzyme
MKNSPALIAPRVSGSVAAAGCACSASTLDAGGWLRIAGIFRLASALCTANILRFACMFCFALPACSAGDGDAAQQTSTTRPNVLVILADDLGFSDLGCYGSEIATPVLDTLAANGLRYTQFYNTGRCWPTRGSLLTGYYAQQIERDALPGNNGGTRGQRPAWARLLPDYLRPLGYRSYISGKWHVDGKPLANGFDRAYLMEDHDRYFNPQRHELDGKPLPPVDADTDYYQSTAIAEHAIECLREHASNHGGQPFFQYVAFTAPHFPLHAPAADIAKYARRYDSGWDSIRRERSSRQLAAGLVNVAPGPLEQAVGPPYAFPDAMAKLGAGEVHRELEWNSLTSQQREFQAAKMAVHAAMIDRMDQEIGRIVAELRAMGAFDNTLIMFLSDNGASAEIMVRGDGHQPAAAPGSARTFLCLGPGWSRAANTPLRRHKTWVHEGGIATPLIVHWPAGIQAQNELRTRVGHVVDLAPTIMELAGGQWPPASAASQRPHAPGESLVASFRTDAQRAAPVWWLHEGNRALRDGNWKVVAAKQEDWQLYDLSTDRAELNDLASQQPEKLRELTQRWESLTQAMLEHLQQ